jgi:hypothetical protein
MSVLGANHYAEGAAHELIAGGVFKLVSGGVDD